MGIFFNGIRSVQTVRACLFYWQVYSALVLVIFGEQSWYSSLWCLKQETTLKQDNQTEALKDEALFVPKYRTDWFKCLYPSYLESATPSSVGIFDAVANVSRGGKSFALRVWCSRQNK